MPPLRCVTGARRRSQPGAPQTPNGDEAKYADKSATYSKGLKQKSYGIVDPDVFEAFRAALGSSDGMTVGAMNFEDPNIVLGGYSPQHKSPPFYTRLNGPAGAFALPMIGADAQYFAAPPAFEIDSIDYALELIELYWASLLRDVPFSEYRINATAIAAANGLTKLRTKFNGHYYGPVDASGTVTPDLLFRGGPRQISNKTYFGGEDLGPYISQLCIQPTHLGAQPIDQKMLIYVAGVNYLTDLDSWFAAQNGKVAALNVADGVPPLYAQRPGARHLHAHCRDLAGLFCRLSGAAQSGHAGEPDQSLCRL